MDVCVEFQRIYYLFWLFTHDFWNTITPPAALMYKILKSYCWILYWLNFFSFSFFLFFCVCHLHQKLLRNATSLQNRKILKLALDMISLWTDTVPVVFSLVLLSLGFIFLGNWVDEGDDGDDDVMAIHIAL